MIVRPRPNLLQLFFVLRGSIVLRIFPQILVISLLSGAVVWLHRTHPGLLPAFTGGPFALLGITLSIFLGFRNSACYDRWWEARKQWGILIFAARAFVRQSLVLGTETPERRRLLTLAIAFAQALVPHLRPNSDDDKVYRHLTVADRTRYHGAINRPDLVARLIAEELADLRATARIGDIPFQMLDRTFSEMAMVQAACERIRSTPVPFGYTLLLHRTAYLFCFLLPFGFADILGWATPLATGLVAYTFFGLDTLGEELEEPFGSLPNDLPISALANTIERDVLDSLGIADLPPVPVPHDYILT